MTWADHVRHREERIERANANTPPEIMKKLDILNVYMKLRGLHCVATRQTDDFWMLNWEIVHKPAGYDQIYFNSLDQMWRFVEDIPPSD